MDLVAGAARLPLRGETLPGRAFAMHPGGKGGNQAAQVALQGVPAAIVGRVGADAFGHRLRDALRSKGVDVAHLGVDPEVATGASVVVTGEGGDYASVVVPGAGLRLSPADLEAARPHFARSAVLLAQFELAPAIVASAVAMAKGLGKRVVLNASPAPAGASAVPPSVWDGVDVLIVNEVEGGQLAETEGSGLAAGLEVAAALAARLSIATVIVTLGAAGAVLADGGRRRHYPAWPIDPVDTIGAGDAFAGTFAAGLARAAGTEPAIRSAMAAGALAATRSGAYDALPTEDEVQRFLAKREAVRGSGSSGNW